MHFNYKYIIAITLVSALGGLLFGYDWVVIGGAKPFYEKYLAIDGMPNLQGWAMSCALVGCVAGALFSGMFSDAYGRKKLLIIAAGLFVVSAIGTGASNDYAAFVLFRILGGIGIGLASNLSPMYIAEVTPSHFRGKFVALNQFTIVIGILAAQIANWLIAEPVPEEASAQEILHSWNGQWGWRWMFWAENVPAILFFFLVMLIPESPRWLMARKGQKKQAFSILEKIGGPQHAQNETQNIEESLREHQSLENEIKASVKGSKLKIFSLKDRLASLKPLFQPGIRYLLLTGIVLAVFQQWCGINVIFNYADEVFSAAGYSVTELLFNIVITGSVNLIFTIVAMQTVDQWGRKILMQIGSLGLFFIYAAIGALYYFQYQGWPLLVLIVLGIAIYALTLAPVTWVLLSEIFPNRIRGRAMATATIALWTASFVLTYTFPLLNNAFKASGTFWIYGGICLAGFIFIQKHLTETKGKSLEEIEDEMLKGYQTSFKKDPGKENEINNITSHETGK